jgi:hypothetical protein
MASTLGALQSRPIWYATGQGYSIQLAENSDEIEALAAGFLQQHESDIEWVTTEFARCTAADLELASTIVFIDRENAGHPTEGAELVRRVNEVKPHFSVERIAARIDQLKTREVLENVN